jgi:WD40 repeat protein
VLVGSWNSKVYLYSTQFNKEVDSFVAHDDSVSAMKYCSNKLITGGWDTLVRLWNVRNDSVEKMPFIELLDLDSEIVSVDLADNGVFVAASDSERVLVGDVRNYIFCFFFNFLIYFF